jgi:aspartate carbamoyltransferase catalytic subunit
MTATSHLLTLDGMPAGRLRAFLDEAQALLPDALGGTAHRHVLAGRAVCTLFFEPSTRTRSSFHFAGKRLGADMLNFNVANSSTTKGETAVDTMRNLEAMGVDAFVVRHSQDGAVAELADAARRIRNA